MTEEKSLSKGTMFGLLALTAIALAVVFFLVFLPGRKDPGIVEISEEGTATTAAVNLGQVLDAIADKNLQAVEGARYRVLIEDLSRQGTEGIARIGGLVVFVDGTAVGDTAIIEITRLKASTAEAALISIESRGTHVAKSPAAPKTPSATTGPIFTGTVQEVGSKGDGIVKKEGKVVFVAGTEKGQRVAYQIIEDAEKHAVGRLVEILPTQSSPQPQAPAQPAAAPSGPRPGDEVQPGMEYTVTITEKDRKHPETDGVARINGLVVFVPGSRPGDNLRIRIVSRENRFARAEILGPADATGGP